MVYTAESDPLCYPGTTVLRNKLDLTDQSELDEFETTMFVLRSEEPWPEGNLDVSHYLALHHHLFQDVYDWGGEIRTISVRVATGSASRNLSQTSLIGFSRSWRGRIISKV